MKVRIGYGFGVRTQLNDDSFAEVVDALERLRFDSLWLSERIGGEAPDPLVAMAFAAGRTTKLKFGMSVMVLPGRNPVVLAKELATLDRLSNGRVLPAFGLGVADEHEQQAFGVDRKERAKIFDEALAVLRGAWGAEPFSFDGTYFHYDQLRVLPKPRQHHVDVWLGGIAPSELRRVGRLADG
ncbi:MAG: putative oxidoreductase, partial [Ilumatobacteraceae bacterium]|nr:putative oxidoreductase [Ilumatobacteraceae bacterium]